jgi:hypothetical protein
VIIYSHSTSLPLLPVPWARPSRKQRYRSQAKRAKIWRGRENTILRGWESKMMPGIGRLPRDPTIVRPIIPVFGATTHMFGTPPSSGESYPRRCCRCCAWLESAPSEAGTRDPTRGHCEPHTTSSSLRRLSHGNSKRSRNTLVRTPWSAGIDVAIAHLAVMIAIIAHPRVACLGRERLGRQGPKGMCG